jgi:hypothetical protein
MRAAFFIKEAEGGDRATEAAAGNKGGGFCNAGYF